MIRTAFALVAVASFLSPLAAAEPKPSVELAGSVEDEALAKELPANGVIVSQKGYEKLTKSWGIQDAPKVDFAKEILVVGTWRGSIFNLTPMVKDGDLTTATFGTKDLRPGFRWKMVSVKRDGIKTVQGKELPKE